MPSGVHPLGGGAQAPLAPGDPVSGDPSAGDPEPGYIKGYPPGVRENGGQYTHAAIWAAMALARGGERQRSAALVSMLNPIHHTRDLEAAERYRVEPYVMAADVYGEAPHTGRGGWTWYTGSAAWYYRHIVEEMLGLNRQGATLQLRPQVPHDWHHFEVRYRFGASGYLIRFEQAPPLAGLPQLTVDGARVAGHTLALVDDGHDHTAHFKFCDPTPLPPPGAQR
jgi:cellobiose phosphorylase